ncbi:hypothetical protein E1B28_001206 [Marasmius oreades]|uniref:J domain-containing protein n=1 Tax=Marasmius oreades TaxID=181124 RepID=A0A9P7V300_9AGAR|nr:uncharacterized protein E1B28_001206 [Marasmius oreades]KAG7099350.1 hypothetical protein E1B28_001206 [Marasmius oreades]
MSQFPDYYRLLGISRTATQDEIRQAYKQESLRTHPDRLVNAIPEEKQKATERFQAVADAYYVLSDKTRRREYDQLYNSRTSNDRSGDPGSSSNFFSQFAGMFGGANANNGETNGGTQRPDADDVFVDVFDELLRPEVERHIPLWTYLGAVCGAGVGFIIANIPGSMIGAYAGNRLGAIRDAKGKSVASVFNDLGGNRKAEILRALALKVLGSAL